MLTITKVIKFTMHSREDNYPELRNKLGELYINAQRCECVKTETPYGDMYRCHFTCEADEKKFNELCDWLNKDFKKNVHIRRYI